MGIYLFFLFFECHFNIKKEPTLKWILVPKVYSLSPKVEDDISKNVCHVYKLIGVEAGRLLGDWRHR